MDSAERRKRGVSAPVAHRVLASWAPALGLADSGCSRGAWPEHSPSSEEKEAEVSMALWKFSSIFRPSSMFGPGREDLQRRGSRASGVRALWDAAAALLGRAGGSVQSDQTEPEGRGQPGGTRGGRGGWSPRAAPTDLTSLEVHALCT